MLRGNMTKTEITRHLDLGCGAFPRNPYKRDELFGVDFGRHADKPNIRQSNLVTDGIPYEDSYFDSISAFDFIEHVPRQVVDYKENITRFPFIELMQEIWRVGKNGARFYALTPAYPSREAFQDPTHVNFITEMTHLYFCGDDVHASRYGFTGRFQEIRYGRVVTKDAYDMDESIKKRLRLLHRKILKPGKLTHLMWELEIVKND
jgi:SAM-dependent methyltransferase